MINWCCSLSNFWSPVWQIHGSPCHVPGPIFHITMTTPDVDPLSEPLHQPQPLLPLIQTSNTISFLPGDPKRPLAVMSGHQAGCNTDHWAIIIYIYCQTLTVHPNRDLYRYIYHLSHFIIITLIMVTNQISGVNLYSYHCRLVSVVLPSSYTAG